MYLSMVVVLFGVSVLLGTATPLVVIPVFVWLIQRRFIIKEEEFMEKHFGEEYLSYKGKVRRWL